MFLSFNIRYVYLKTKWISNVQLNIACVYSPETLKRGSLPEATCGDPNPRKQGYNYKCFCDDGFVRDISRGFDGPCVEQSQCPRQGPYNPQPKYIQGFSKSFNGYGQDLVVTDTRIQNEWDVNPLSYRN